MSNKAAQEVIELSTFYIDDYFLGVDIKMVQEINRKMNLTKVYHAPDYIAGVVNLRGEVITVIDLRKKLGLPDKEGRDKWHNIVINYEGSKIGLLVDKIDDIIFANEEDTESPPPHLREIEGKFFYKVVKLKNKLLAILDINAMLA
ncbi:chemotaxis protein CheW [Candidatus Auribacterota bacterium]